MTSEILRTEGNSPVSKDLLIKVEIGLEISRFSSFRILIGMLFGPEDLDSEKFPIILVISSGVVGLRKRELGFLNLRNLEKWEFDGGILDLIVSATDVKKSLKWLATSSGLDEMEFPIDSEMGLQDLEDLELMISRIPDHIFCILFELCKKYLV